MSTFEVYLVRAFGKFVGYHFFCKVVLKFIYLYTYRLNYYNQCRRRQKVIMITVKSSRFLWSRFNRNINKIIQNNVRSLSSGNKLVDVQVNSKTGIATVTMQRPPVNSLSLELVNELISVMLEVEKNKGRGMILTSSCPGVFSAGLDIMELYKPSQDRLKSYWTAIQDMWLNLYSSDYSTAAAITGHSPGAGCLIAVSCDYRIMVQGSYGIGFNETQLGLGVPSWFVDSFRNVVPKRISEMALIEGKLFSVKEAFDAGLIDEVVANNNEAIAKAEDYMARLSKFNLNAMAQTKLTIRYNTIKRLQDSREHDLRVFLKFVNAPETQKGLEIYLESLKKKK